MKDPSLSSLAVLAIDCQAAYSLPPDDQLLEVGWNRACASLPIKPEDASRGAEAYFVKKPAKTRIPEKALSITGIKQEELYGGVSKKIFGTDSVVPLENWQSKIREFLRR